MYRHRAKKVVVIKCENQSEKSALCRYPYNIDLQATTESMTFRASIEKIPDEVFEFSRFDIFKKEVLK